MKLTILLLPLFILTGCANNLAQINWNDPRCFSWTEYNTKYQRENNKLAAVAAFMSRDLDKALILSGNPAISWDQGVTGDDRRLWVGYSDDNRVIGYKDENGVDLSVAEVSELGGVMTRRSTFPIGDINFYQKQILGPASPEYRKPVIAKKRPTNCSN
jgi:hypothetical protein